MGFSFSCAITPNQINEIPDSILKKQELFVSADNYIVTSIFCSELQKANAYERLTCKNGQGDNKPDLTLKIGILVKNSSSDYWRNSRYSLYTLGALLLVTTSADIEYRFTFMNQSQVLKNFTLSSHGRIGVWAVQPFLMGFIGLSLGTAINTDMLPETLHKECNSINSNDSLLENRKCQAYQRFIEDSLSYIWKDFLKIQADFFKTENQWHLNITQNHDQKLNLFDIIAFKQATCC